MMLKMYRFFLFYCFFISSFAYLQAQHCATPDSAIWRKPNTAFQKMPSGILTIPVVVHVVWKDDEDNISNEQIQSQIDALNRDFQQKNDQSKITSDFLPLAANVGIEFCLAKTDPKGKATTGITRTKTSYDNVWQTMGTTLNNPTPRRRIYYTILEGRDAWDTKKYLNIWVGKLGGGKAGYGTFPNAIKSEDVDGIVVDPNFFGTIGTAANNAGFNLGRTAVHEVGHYLNLLHPWGNGISNFNCSSDDMVDDTPKQEEAISNCPNTFVFHCGKKVMTMNFMNFVYDDCMSMFTNGQKTRMLDALMAFRGELLTSSACQSVTSNDNILNRQIEIYPNPANDELKIVLRDIESANFTIFDIAGKPIEQGKLTNYNNFINVSNFAAGFYQVGINIENNYMLKPLVIQH
jgi:hypothetical protein